MTYQSYGFKTISHIGSIAGLAGTNLALHAYVTSDDGPTVETSGYFNTLAKRLKVGDQITVTLGVGGTVQLRNYFVATNDGTTVTIGRESTGVTGGISNLSFFVNLADIASAADVITAYTPGYAGKILSFDFLVGKPVTTAAKLATLTPKINSTNTTGGAVALTSALATPMGAKIAGSAITAANVFAATDTIGIVASAVTAFVEGNGWMVLRVQNTDG